MKHYTVLFVLLSSLCFAQQDTIVLQDILVSDIRLSKNKTQRVIELNDSILDQNSPLLTDLLRFYSTIFFKENGKGMVSSPSFRGTTAQQTSVLWNGIGINSGFLGQSDFNTISSLGVDEIIIKPGGGSISHGSGAIGGSIHLNHQLKFNQGIHGKFLGGFGSFNTIKAFGKIGYSNDKVSANISYNRNSSDNDFEVEEEEFINRNAQYYNNTYNLNVGYKFNANNILSLYTEKYNDERHFVILEESASKAKYRNNNFRSLLQWDNIWQDLEQTVKIGYFQEEFTYFDKIDRAYFSQGQIKKYVAQYMGGYKIKPKLKISLLGEISDSYAKGDNTGIVNENQIDGNIGLIFTHQLIDKFYYELGVRKEFNKDYKSPTLYSLGLAATTFKVLKTRFNISKNFRAPSLNDLYWEPGGNKDLLAESSVQYELTEELNFKGQTLGVNVYLNDIENMIQWVPTSAGYWAPRNTTNVQAKGIEVYANLSKAFGSHTIKFNSQYAYTLSKNQDTDTQLAYVPYHKWNGSLSYNYKPLSIYIQGILIGDTFITVDENPDYVLEGYNVFNAGLNFRLPKYLGLKTNAGFKINNVFDNIYQIKPKYYNPKRNFEIQLITNF